MEIQINKEIKDYKETFMLGLTLRQAVFSVLTIGAALLAWKLCPTTLGLEIKSWICILAAAPFALLGFLKYEGIRATEFVRVWIRYQLTPKQITYQAENVFYDFLKEVIEKPQKPPKKQPGKKEKKTSVHHHKENKAA